MRYLALACDYDGTLAKHGSVAKDTLAALERLRATGRKLVLVTGRVLRDLLAILPRPELFDRIVAENGAILYRPLGREERVLAEAPPPWFVDKLREKGVGPLSMGRAIVATNASRQTRALISEAITSRYTLPARP
jgi:hydroxymethylpyrimidine pyrophosphatase-like HAD family hydrolase